jgi:hypothetical protein
MAGPEPLDEPAGWGLEALAVEFGELKALDFDLSLTAIDPREIDVFADDRRGQGPVTPCLSLHPYSLSAVASIWARKA